MKVGELKEEIQKFIGPDNYTLLMGTFESTEIIILLNGFNEKPLQAHLIKKIPAYMTLSIINLGDYRE